MIEKILPFFNNEQNEIVAVLAENILLVQASTACILLDERLVKIVDHLLKHQNAIVR